jgi:trk system potassium uptake protein TrkA
MKFKKKIANRFAIIDSDKTLCNQAKEKFPSAQVFCADATDENFIREEGLDKFDLVICATHNHEMNMIISAYIESLGVEKTIALVAHSDLSQIARKLGVDVPIPMRDTLVDSIMSHIYGKNITGIHTVANGDFEIVECDISSKSKYSDKLLKEISSPGDFLVLLVRKRGEIDYSLPSGDTRLSPGDHIVLIAKSNDQKILTRFCETI